ncbi:hypothetical protein THMIRHAS_06720 [Thiosulfatimonas sediminis]|uniref:Uncharacterized protein n=1 Tax=Thiosulfatimonas sediminis TaxID=2675054 RepID=A0A6F8PT65_9GAMM|nr:hypothetical protein [Thiosulfatimonas sediminis]BBP45299.1 hypothetical protein THMIRHAS_06720 [Thiosulfatimonas sediminis]
MKTLENMEISTLGWMSSAWQSDFYPEDLPSEWFFDYYLNYFRLACVPASEWLQWRVDNGLSSTAFANFADCVNQQNRLLLVAGEADFDELQRLLPLLQCTSLGEQLIGVLLQAEGHLPPQSVAGYPLTLLSRQLQWPGWSWQAGELTVSGAPLCWISELPTNGREQSQLLKSFMQSLAEPLAVPVCIADENAQMSDIRNLQTVAELLGY